MCTRNLCETQTKRIGELVRTIMVRYHSRAHFTDRVVAAPIPAACRATYTQNLPPLMCYPTREEKRGVEAWRLGIIQLFRCLVQGDWPLGGKTHQDHPSDVT